MPYAATYDTTQTGCIFTAHVETTILLEDLIRQNNKSNEYIHFLKYYFKNINQNQFEIALFYGEATHSIVSTISIFWGREHSFSFS